MSLISVYYNKFRQYFSTNYPRTYTFCNNRKAVIKFIVAGGAAGGTDLVLLFIFHGLLDLDIVLATSLAFILSFLISFSLQKFWTFRNHHRNRMMRQLAIYLLNAFIGLALNAAGMHLLVNEYAIWYILAQIIVNVAIGFWNFVIYKFIIFKNQPHEVLS